MQVVHCSFLGFISHILVHVFNFAHAPQYTPSHLTVCGRLMSPSTFSHYRCKHPSVRRKVIPTPRPDTKALIQVLLVFIPRALRVWKGDTKSAHADCPSNKETSYVDKTVNPCCSARPTTRLLDCEESIFVLITSLTQSSNSKPKYKTTTKYNFYV